MKKIAAVLLAVLMLTMIMAGCGGDAGSSAPASAAPDAGGESVADEGGDEPAASGEGALIVYVCDGFSDRFSNWMCTTMEQQVAENYPDYTLNILDGQFDDSVQAEQLENAISMNPDVLIFNQHSPLVCVPQQQAAMDAGITVINTQSPFLNEDDEIMAPYVDSDMTVVGKMIAEYAMTIIPENAKAAILLGPANNVHSELRLAGWEEVLESRPDIEILDQQIGDWKTDEGMRIAEDWYQAYPELSVIIALNDNMALGAIEAAKAIDKEIMAFGVDGMLDACYSVKSGELKGTVLQDARALCAGALELADRAIKGETLTVEDSLHTPGALITPDNVDEFIAIHEESEGIE